MLKASENNIQASIAAQTGCSRRLTDENAVERCANAHAINPCPSKCEIQASANRLVQPLKVSGMNSSPDIRQTGYRINTNDIPLQNIIVAVLNLDRNLPTEIR